MYTQIVLSLLFFVKYLFLSMILYNCSRSHIYWQTCSNIKLLMCLLSGNRWWQSTHKNNHYTFLDSSSQLTVHSWFKIIHQPISDASVWQHHQLIHDVCDSISSWFMMSVCGGIIIWYMTSVCDSIVSATNVWQLHQLISDISVWQHNQLICDIIVLCVTASSADLYE